MKKLLSLFIGLAVVLFASPSFAQDQTATKTTWGAVKARYANPALSQSTTEVGRAIADPGVETSAVRTTGYQPVRTDWRGAFYNPHFALIFHIPHSTTTVTRSAGIPTNVEGGLANWTSSRSSLGNGWDEYVLLVPKRVRVPYFYLTDWEFSRYFWLWATYSY